MKPFVCYARRKPVFILLQGRSIVGFDVIRYQHEQIVWVSLNDFRAIEDNILSKIDKVFDIIYCSSDQRYEMIKDRLGGKQLLTTTRLNEKHSLHAWANDDAYGFCSLWALICALINLGFKDMYIFGCDGYDSNGTYYGMPYEKKGIASIVRDYEIMSKYFWELTEYWGLDLRGVRILNMNPKSKLLCFDRMDEGNLAVPLVLEQTKPF